MNHGSQNILQEGRQQPNGRQATGGATELEARQGEAVAEEWRSVVGYEGLYEVSNIGRVRSLTRKCRAGGFGGHKVMGGRIMSQCRTGKTARSSGRGYLACRLTVETGSKLVKVHRAVAIAFILNPGGLPQVNHKDTNTLNNHVDNLEWIDNTGNIRHASRMGLLRPMRGEACVTHKLTSSEVVQLRAIYAAGGRSTRSVAKQFGIGWSQTKRIINKESWAHIY